MDDEFAKDVSEFDTIKELRNSIREKLEEENKQRTKYETEDAVIKAVADNVEVEIPSGMVDTQIDNMVKDMENRLAYQGMALEQYLQMIGKTMADFREAYKEQVENEVKIRLVLEAVGKDAKIEVEEKDIEEKIKEMAEKYNKEETEIKENENIRKYIEENLKTEKIIAYLVENAKIK